MKHLVLGAVDTLEDVASLAHSNKPAIMLEEQRAGLNQSADDQELLSEEEEEDEESDEASPFNRVKKD